MRFPTALVVALTALLVIAPLGATALPQPAAQVGDDRTQSPVFTHDPSSVSVTSDARPRTDARPTALATTDGATASTAKSDGHLSTIANRTRPEPATPRQVIRIELTADGDANWTIESRYRLETQDDLDALEAFAADVAAGEGDVGYDAGAYEPFAALAANETGREMGIVDAGWAEPAVMDENETIPLADASLENDTVATGVLAYHFTWTNFARTDGSRIYLGDVFRTDGGTWFQSLADDQRLVLEPPSNYGYEELPRTPEDGALVWDGPHEFGDDELSVTYLRGANPPNNETDVTGPTTGDPGGSGESTGGDPSEGSGFPSLTTAVGLVILLLVVGGAGYYLARRNPTSTEDAEATPDAAAEGTQSNPTTTAEADSTRDDDGSGTDSVVSTYQEGGLEGAPEPETDEGDRDADESAGDDEIDVELLSDEERVHRLLRRNDGRMKQVSIVSETGWSNAKVSQLLSEMDENGEIEKLRIGRENLITLPEVDPTEID